LPVDGDPQKTGWVLKIGLNPGGLQGGSGEQYFVGRFDGKTFTNDNPVSLSLWSDYGKDCYCALTFNNLPPAQPSVMLGWMNNWQYADRVPTHPWRGQMTIPRELALKTFPEGVRLVQKPVASLASLRGKPAKKITTRSFEVKTGMQINGAKEAGWKLKAKDGTYTVIGYDRSKQELFVDRTHSGLVAFSDRFPARTAAPLPGMSTINLDILVDGNSIEVFADDGRLAITNLVFPTAAPASFDFYSDGDAKALPTTVWPLKSIW